MCAGGPKWPFWGQIWPPMAGLPMSQSGLKEFKMIPNGQNDMLLIIWGHFGPIWTVWNHYRQNLIFCFESLWPKALSVFEAKNQVLSEMITKSPNGPKMVPNDEKHIIFIIWYHLDHFRPIWDIGMLALFGDFWSQKGPFGPPVYMIEEWQ